jgi:hypothetical protein
MRRALAAEGVLLLVLLTSVGVLYARATTLSWTYDDAFLLRVVDGAQLDDYFASPQFWRAMPAQMFVPLLLVWYEGGSRVIDDADGGFYRAAIVLLIVSLCAVYFAMRLWFGAVESLTTIALIGLGPPIVSIVTQLMATHYLLALALAALSFAAYTLALRRSSIMLAIVSAGFFLAAMLAKEVAIPLPALLLLLPGATRRPRYILPHLAALGLYFVWRKVMIGVFLGGYGWAVTSETIGPIVRSLPRQWLVAITPPQWWIALLLGIVVLVPIAMRMCSRRYAMAVIVALGAAIMPVLPVSREMQPRYAFASWVTLTVLFTIAARAWPSRVRAFLSAFAVAIVCIAQRAEWAAVYPLAVRMSAETRFVLRAPADATLRLPQTPPAAMGELQWLRSKEGLAAGLQWFYDDLYLCAGRQGGRRLYEYDQRRGEVVDVTRAAAAMTRRHCTSIRESAPMRTEFRFEEGTLHWTFGPYEAGTWHVLFGDGVQAFAVPPRDAYRIGDMPGISLRVRYDSPQGWVTYSPELVMEFANAKTMRWQRP